MSEVLDTLKSGWSIFYIKGSKVIISKVIFHSLELELFLANSADPDEMPQYAAFHLGLQFLPKYPFFVFEGFRQMIANPVV